MQAMASDDILVEKLVLKGGNALELVHKIGGRSSLDIDYSIRGDFADLADIERRIKHALDARFRAAGYVVFDVKFVRKPKKVRTPQGYTVEFKVIRTDLWTKAGGNLEKARRQAAHSGPAQERIFSIDMSKDEYCDGSEMVYVDDYQVHVYSPKMIAVEKIRAICQQMDEYPHRKHPAPRPRDFYDIHAILTSRRIRLEDEMPLVSRVFAAKMVSLELLANVRSQRDFHAVAWPSVQMAAGASLKDFDFYFEFVTDKCERLHAIRHP